MLFHDRVICNCCGDDMGQLNGGVCTRPGALVDLTKAPYFAVCPDCNDYCAPKVPPSKLAFERGTQGAQ